MRRSKQRPSNCAKALSNKLTPAGVTINMGMNKYLVTLRLKGQLIKTAVFADSSTHARLICEYQFGLGCLNGAPTQLSSEGHDYPLLDDLTPTSTHTIKPRPSKPPRAATIKPVKPQSPEQMRVTQLKANVDRQKDALKRERENQKRQKEAEHRWRNLGGI